MKTPIEIFSYKIDEPDYYKQSPETGLIEELVINSKYSVLDIGCGCGKQCLTLSEKCKKVIGIDLQQFMIDDAIAKRSAENITYICNDFMNVDFNEEFDIIISQNVMFHVEDKTEFLKKIYSLLKRGGQFVFTDLTRHMCSSTPENLAFPVNATYYSYKLNELGFSNVLFLWEKHWVWDGIYSANNYCMFKCSK